MTQQEQLWFRLDLLCTLIDQAPGRLGRTAIMKLAYLLQTVKCLPLGYDFRLHTYGSFESDVLNDLGSAESWDSEVSDGHVRLRFRVRLRVHHRRPTGTSYARRGKGG